MFIVFIISVSISPFDLQNVLTFSAFYQSRLYPRNCICFEQKNTALPENINVKLGERLWVSQRITQTEKVKCSLWKYSLTLLGSGRVEVNPIIYRLKQIMCYIVLENSSAFLLMLFTCIYFVLVLSNQMLFSLFFLMNSRIGISVNKKLFCSLYRVSNLVFEFIDHVTDYPPSNRVEIYWTSEDKRK